MKNTQRAAIFISITPGFQWMIYSTSRHSNASWIETGCVDIGDALVISSWCIATQSQKLPDCCQ